MLLYSRIKELQARQAKKPLGESLQKELDELYRKAVELRQKAKVKNGSTEAKTNR